jgi:hypothetical protein
MEPEGSLQCSQEPAISPYPVPDKSSPYPPNLLPLHPFEYCLPIYA